MRVAAVDLGTNTTRLLVADVDDGRIEELHRETRITRLGEGVDARRRLLPVPIARVRNVLSEYRRTLESLGAERTLVVATSAVREAENGEAFLGEVEWSYGFSTMLLSGEEEGRLTRRGVGSGREPDPGTLILDIGGGSTELIVDEHHDSLELGSVRQTARTQLERLAALPLTERRAVPALEPERAPVIVAGAVILVETLDFFGLDAIEASELDILDGAALAAAELPSPEEGAAPPGAYTYC